MDFPVLQQVHLANLGQGSNDGKGAVCDRRHCCTLAPHDAFNPPQHVTPPHCLARIYCAPSNVTHSDSCSIHPACLALLPPVLQLLPCSNMTRTLIPCLISAETLIVTGSEYGS